MGVEDLLADDRSARELALDPTRSFIVQAPAGSGKTELLIQRYLKLLATVDNPEEVLAITFTRKAAAEMQTRLLAALRHASRGETPEPPHLRLTATLALDVLRRDEQRDWRLLTNPRRMRIQTLDALHASIARARPLLAAENPVASRILVDAELDTMHRAAAMATLDWLTETGPLREAIRDVLVHVDTNTTLYVAYLARMLATRDQWLPFVASGALGAGEAEDLRTRLEANIEAAVTAHLESALALLPVTHGPGLAELANYAAENLVADGAGDSPIAALRGIDALPPASPDAMDAWLGLCELLLTASGSWRRSIDKRQGFPPGEAARKQQMKDLIAELSASESLAPSLHALRSLPPPRYGDEQWSVLLALFSLLPVAVSELKRLFSENGVVDHIEVALTASRVLGSADEPGDVALLLDYQLRHLLVDEMQDTSSAQYRMLEALTGGWQQGDGRTLFCVGDPMQSIYRFRNAEVGQFLFAREQGIGDLRLEPLTLRRNFRSGALLVDWFNRVFPSILAERDDPMRGAVGYSTAAGVPQLAGIGECTVHPLLGSSRQQEAERGCAIVGDTLAANPDDQMAILVRSRTQLPGLLALLRRRGIRYRAVEIDRLTDLPEMIEVLALTRAAVHQADRLAWMAILRAPWTGLDWRDLHALVRNDSDRTVWQLLSDEQRRNTLSAQGRAAVERAMPALVELIAPRRADGLRDAVERCWMRLGGPAIPGDGHAIENVYRYLDLLEQQESRGSLADVAELESMLDKQRVSSDIDARLQVMTMHRAKGLEFDHVLLYGLGRIPGRSEPRVMSWFDLPGAHGAERKILSPVGPRAELGKDPLHRFIELADGEKDRNEQARLLYVACTRARRTLHLLGHTGVSPDGESCRPPPKASLLAMLWPAVRRHYDAALAEAGAPAEESQAERWLQPALRRLSPPWALPATPALSWETADGPGAADGGAVEFYWVGTEARIAGTLVHRWLHLFATGRITPPATGPGELRPVTERWLEEAGMAAGLRPAIQERVDSALAGVLEDPRGRWLVESDGHAELGLTGLFEGGLESVMLDRVVIEPDGTHWIVDYKTSSHEGGDLPGFLRAESERYEPQLRKYAEIYRAFAGVQPRCALYFPLLRRFVEV